MFILYFFLIWGLIEIVFWLTHRRDLTDSEMKKLSQKRRGKYIKENYNFRLVNSFPDKKFKSSMDSKGKMYRANISLKDFPSYAANLLKWKKHEWVLLALVQDKQVKFFFANKGLDNSSVSYNCNIYNLLKICKDNGCQTIMRFHNHPNSDPQHYTCLLPSNQDKISAKSISEIAIVEGINWLDFVCERGSFSSFYREFSKTFFPQTSKIRYIKEENGKSKTLNYKLQHELGIFR